MYDKAEKILCDAFLLLGNFDEVLKNETHHTKTTPPYIFLINIYFDKIIFLHTERETKNDCKPN